MRYTVIYSEFFTRGSHTHSLVRYLRIVVPAEEAIAMVLSAYNVEMSQVQFIFEGWPKQQGDAAMPVESVKEYVDGQ